jgi:hypothetical protein
MDKQGKGALHDIFIEQSKSFKKQVPLHLNEKDYFEDKALPLQGPSGTHKGSLREEIEAFLNIRIF